ncbi:protein kinase [Pseudenhygromyxa sp. WMMC2535]|uniref:serine/threonine-protein kinase n=1 Tax=Pseudenhygromyxa sp. WMMC2535 TaxID=2712867 RepID=UPI001595B1DC|nr:serine/threonine-protein kinase [Pseudenhygromyxa sp. WMMC2535]NVB42422.1 protein kinase [Pseudenhygromyxa sp. WMMC2535]
MFAAQRVCSKQFRPLSTHGHTPDPDLLSHGEETIIERFGGPGTLDGEDELLAQISERHGPGEQLGPYEIQLNLGAGGMGEVFAARHTVTDEVVALKMLSRTTPGLLYRFKREFRALADVSHRNLVSLGELIVLPSGTAFFTMELVDGMPFVTYVRREVMAGSLPNMVRLGRAFRQLVAGLDRLHQAGCVHRDIKPSNVLVTREGRVVILDFGLVSELAEPDEGISRDGQLLGTPAYMAPEQAAMSEVSPASDFYAVGVLLYESLCGRLPFKGSPLEIMLAKQDGEAPDPAEHVAGIPSSLRTLCREALAVEPADRPDANTLISAFGRLAGGSGPISVSDQLPNLRTRKPFVGRRSELGLLSRALADVQLCGEAVTVHVHGASGHGKSALISRFLSEVRRGDEALVLRGRCLERESVPYKGVDSVVDALSAHLRRRPEVELAGFRPRYLAPLVQIFPVLADVWSLRGRPVRRFEPGEMRRLGLAALREVFTRLADERPLVVHIDDFQWADVDGARLLSSLVRPPDPPAMLLLVSFRDEPESEQPEALRELLSSEARLGRDLRDIVLQPLPEDDARRLAGLLLGADQAGSRAKREQVEKRAAAYARSARGNPFYIGQMVLDAGSTVGDTQAGDDRIVARRIVALAPQARRVLAIAAVAGGPTPIPVVRRVYESLSADESWVEGISVVDEVMDRLVELDLVSIRDEIDSQDSMLGSLPGSTLDAAHGRIREVMVGELAPDELRRVHLELARALEHLGGEPEALAEHYEYGGEPLQAAAFAEEAAEQAVENLAFGRAVELYRRALELSEAEGDPKRRLRLRVALATQLVNFGHSSEAGRLLRTLADEVDPARALSFKCEAAEQLLHAGHLEEGLALSAEVLEKSDEPTPKSTWRTMLRFVFGRLRLWLRGMNFTKRSEDEVPAATLERIDTLMTIYRGLLLHIELHSWVLHNRLLRLTLDAGEPRRLGAMLAYEMTMTAVFGGQGKVHAMASQARELAAEVNDLELDRVIDFQRDMVDYALNRFSDATDQLRDLLPRLEDVPGADWIRFSSVLVYSSLCTITGRWRELSRNLAQWLAAARDRGNLREVVELEAYAALTELHRGDVRQARYHIETGRAAWQATRYTFTGFTIDRAEIFLLLGEGEGDKALARVDQLTNSVWRSMIALNPVVKRFVEQLTARCLALAAMRRPTDTQLQTRLRKISKTMRKSKISLYVGEAVLADAALCSLARDVSGARKHWRVAELLFDEHGIQCHLAATRWQLAQVTEGEESERFAKQARTYFELNGINQPEVVAGLLAPNIDMPNAAFAATIDAEEI